MKTSTRRPRRGGEKKQARIPAQVFQPKTFTGHIEFIEGSAVPKVFVTLDALSRMYHLVDIANQEVGWLGTVQRTKRGNFVIGEVFLLEQEVSASQTELSVDGQAKLAQHLIETREDGVETVNQLRFWGHSHVRMPTNPSPPDEHQMDLFKENGCPWFIRGIFNKDGAARFDIFFFESGMKVVDAEWGIWDQVNYNVRAELEAEFANKVVPSKPYQYTPPPPPAKQGAWWRGPVQLPVQYGGVDYGNGVVVVLPPYNGSTSNVG